MIIFFSLPSSSLGDSSQSRLKDGVMMIVLTSRQDVKAVSVTTLKQWVEKQWVALRSCSPSLLPARIKLGLLYFPRPSILIQDCLFAASSHWVIFRYEFWSFCCWRNAVNVIVGFFLLTQFSCTAEWTRGGRHQWKALCLQEWWQQALGCAILPRNGQFLTKFLNGWAFWCMCSQLSLSFT